MPLSNASHTPSAPLRVAWPPFTLFILLTLFFTACSNMITGNKNENKYGSSAPCGRSFVINGGAPYAYQLDVVLSIDVSNSRRMRFRNVPGEWSDWEPYAGSKSWMLPYGNGTKTVEAEFRSADNESITMDDAIEFIDRITAIDGASHRRFGSAVSVSADGATVVVGVPAYDKHRGAVYVYRFSRGAWEPVTLLTGAIDPDALPGDDLGHSVALSADGDCIAAGAPGHDGARGAVYMFERNNGGADQWGLRERLIAGQAGENDMLGHSVAASFDGGTIIAGAPWRDGTGRLHVFRRTGVRWTEETVLAASDGDAGDQFGCAVAISADAGAILAGAMERRIDTATARGAVYHYSLEGASWKETVFIAGDGSAGDYFGAAVSISADGDTFCVGAYGHDGRSGLYGLGCAYVYTRTAGSWREHRILAPDGAGSDYFARSIAITMDGSILAAGAWGNAPLSLRTGSVYLFGRDHGDAGEWGMLAKLIAPDGNAGDQFGITLALSSEGTLIAGASGDDTGPGEDQGSVYVFKDSY